MSLDSPRIIVREEGGGEKNLEVENLKRRLKNKMKRIFENLDEKRTAAKNKTKEIDDQIETFVDTVVGSLFEEPNESDDGSGEV